MSVCATIYLNLPQWDGGSRKIRFIYLVNQTSFRLTECPDKNPAVPLYLGADLFANTSVRTENHPRYHAKFAKKGLATKINFSSAFRFHGLKVPTANNSLWFYSVQGLFRVAFEMYSKEGQLAVLDNFQDVWKSQLHDNPLKRSYDLCVQLDFAPVSFLQDTECANKIPVLQKCQLGGEPCETPAAQGYFNSSQNPRLETEQSRSTVATIKEKLLGVNHKLRKNQNCTNLEIVLLLLTNIEQCLNGSLEEKDVTETVLALLMAKDWGCMYSSLLLSCIGQWLGQQFHAVNSKLSQKVESFKVNHIDRITDLPPAEDLTTELFPEAMQTLLLHWMGLNEESSLEKRRAEYPILLLILEFANHNLITGVAHVLYSSLICK